MEHAYKALTTFELMPRTGRPNGNTLGAVVIGDRGEDIQLCTYLRYTRIEHNWYAQHGKIKFANGDIYYYSDQTIKGEKASLFRATEENRSLAIRKKYEREITALLNANAIPPGDLVALADLVLETVGKKPFRPWDGDAKSRIQANLSRLSVGQLAGIAQLIRPYRD